MKCGEEQSPSEILFEFVVEKARESETRKRIQIYRAAAEIMSGVQPYTRQLKDLADRLEAIDDDTLELGLRFRKERL